MKKPPEVPKDPPANVVGKLLPVVMLLAMGGMTVLYFTSGAASSRSPAFLFLPVMMLVSVLGSVAYQSRGARRGGELDADRRAYLRYLDGLDGSLARTAAAQHESLHWSHPDPACAVDVWSAGQRMWERRPDDEDFCHVRVGIGAASAVDRPWWCRSPGVRLAGPVDRRRRRPICSPTGRRCPACPSRWISRAPAHRRGGSAGGGPRSGSGADLPADRPARPGRRAGDRGRQSARCRTGTG